MIRGTVFVRIFLSVLLGLLFIIVPALSRGATVGVLMPGRDIPYYQALHKAMVAELGELGVDVDILLQRPEPAWMAWKNATRKLVVLESEVIVAYGTSTALAVSSEAEAIPMVYCAAYDPKGCGLGGNVTGVAFDPDFAGLLANLKKISHFTRLAILFSHEERGSSRQMKVATGLAEAAGAVVTAIETHDLDKINLSGYDAALLTSAANINTRESIKMIVAQARTQKVATAAVLGLTCEQGILISSYADPVIQGKKAAAMVARILDGGSTMDIKPVTTVAAETVINISEAKRLGLSIPFELLGSARVVK